MQPVPTRIEMKCKDVLVSADKWFNDVRGSGRGGRVISVGGEGEIEIGDARRDEFLIGHGLSVIHRRRIDPGVPSPLQSATASI